MSLGTPEIRDASEYPLKLGELKISSSNACSQLHSPILHAWWLLHLSVFSRTMHSLFARMKNCLKFQVIAVPKARGPWIKMELQVPFGITQSTLSAEARDVFLWNQDLHQDHRARVNLAICIYNIHFLETSPQEAGRLFSPLQNPLLDNFLISHDMPWKWITFAIL